MNLCDSAEGLGRQKKVLPSLLEWLWCVPMRMFTASEMPSQTLDLCSDGRVSVVVFRVIITSCKLLAQPLQTRLCICARQNQGWHKHAGLQRLFTAQVTALGT